MFIVLTDIAVCIGFRGSKYSLIRVWGAFGPRDLHRRSTPNLI